MIEITKVVSVDISIFDIVEVFVEMRSHSQADVLLAISQKIGKKGNNRHATIGYISRSVGMMQPEEKESVQNFLKDLLEESLAYD